MEAAFAAGALLLRAAAMAIGLVLLASAAHKLRDWPTFRAAVSNYRLLPDGLVAPVALALPMLEAVAGIALLVDGLRIAGAWLAVTAIGFATLAVVINLIRGRTAIDCGCGGLGGSQRLSWGLVVRNTVLLVALAIGTTLDAASTGALLDFATLAALTLSLVALLAAASQLLANRSLFIHAVSRS